MVVDGLHPGWIYLAAVSVVTFWAYGFDKRRAIRGKRRIPERWLHLLALAGGTLGALAGQQLFRHKNRKWKFLLVFGFIALVQAAVIGWWVFVRRPS
jgi:uncharacterized membrane protein YsdA (DUF1294 family)